MIKYILVLVYAMTNGSGITMEVTKPLSSNECHLALEIIIADYRKMIEAEMLGGKPIAEKYLITGQCKSVEL